MYKKIAVLLLVVLLSFSLILTGCAQKPAAQEQPKEEQPKEEPKDEPTAPEVVKIGAVYPLTGNLALVGTRVKQAIELAQEIINGEYADIDMALAKTVGLPNLGGAKVEFVFGDSQASPEVGKAEAERLIGNDKVVAMIGAYQSAVTKPTSQVAERYKIPYVCGASSSAALTERGMKYFARIAPTDDTDSKVFFDYMKYLNEKFDAGVKKVALVYENTEFGVHAADMAKKWAENYKADGFEIVADIPYTFAATNVNSEVQKLKAAEPDAIFQASLTADWILFVKTYKELDVNPKVVLNYCGGYQDPKSIENLGKDADFFSGTNAFAETLIDSMPTLKKVNDMYYAKSGVNFDGPAIEIFAAAMVIAEAINDAGSTDSEKIMASLYDKEYSSPVLVAGKINFGSKEGGQNIVAESVMTQVQNGIFEVTYPEEFATKPAVVPIPKWSER